MKNKVEKAFTFMAYANLLILAITFTITLMNVIWNGEFDVIIVKIFLTSLVLNLPIWIILLLNEL